MAEATKIQWCHHSWSPWHGCAKISPGCANCYAERQSHRNPGTLGVWGEHGTRVLAKDWEKPMRWNRAAEKASERRRVFPSICDPFEDRPELVPWRQRFFQLIGATPWLDWLLLTKRPENVLRMAYDAWCRPVPRHVSQNDGDGRHWNWPRNVWLGVSVENDDYRWRVAELLKIPAAVRFISAEPLIGPISLIERFKDGGTRNYLSGQFHGLKCTGVNGNPDFTAETCDPNLPRIHWVIVGGESGRHARPCNVAWIRSIVAQCQAAAVACFVKQLGSMPVMDEAEWRAEPRTRMLLARNHHKTPPGMVPLLLLDSKGGDPEEWPQDSRVREFPATALERMEVSTR